MDVYRLFAIVFVVSTVVMVTAAIVMGFQHWKEERAQSTERPVSPDVDNLAATTSTVSASPAKTAPPEISKGAAA